MRCQGEMGDQGHELMEVSQCRPEGLPPATVGPVQVPARLLAPAEGY